MGVRLLSGRFVAQGLESCARPTTQLFLYESHGSAEGRRVREALDTLDLDVLVMPCPEVRIRLASLSGDAAGAHRPRCARSLSRGSHRSTRTTLRTLLQITHPNHSIPLSLTPPHPSPHSTPPTPSLQTSTLAYPLALSSALLARLWGVFESRAPSLAAKTAARGEALGLPALAAEISKDVPATRYRDEAAAGGGAVTLPVTTFAFDRPGVDCVLGRPRPRPRLRASVHPDSVHPNT